MNDPECKSHTSLSFKLSLIGLYHKNLEESRLAFMKISKRTVAVSNIFHLL